MTASWTRPPFPDAPFYALVDLRAESETLDRFGGATAIRPRTGVAKEDLRGYPPPPTPEELAHKEALKELYRTVGPESFSLQTEHFFWPLSMDVAERKRWIYRAKPKQINHHWERITAITPRIVLAPIYMLFSEAWKSEVEGIEPTPPAFFPFEIEFVTPKRRASHHGFVLRDRAFVRNHTPTHFTPTWDLGANGLEGPWGFRDHENRLVQVTFPSHAVAGRNWFRVPQISAPWSLCPPFVSAQLAEKLLPLMPDRVCLFPAYVA